MRLFPAAVALLLAAPVLAQADERVRILPYRADTVVRVDGQPSFESMIAFAPDEKIENVAVGDATGWQVTPNKRADALFIKPSSMGAVTNMTVLTTTRTYLFELHAEGGPALYSLRFTYASGTAGAGGPAASPDDQAAHLNFGWVASGSRALRPARTFDDGRKLFVAWPRGAALPAMLQPHPGGGEEPLSYVAKRDYLVVERVPDQLILRVGKENASVRREGVSAARPASPSDAALAER